MTETIRKASTADLALLVALSVIWATSFQAIKVAVPETGPLWLVAGRVSVALAALLPWMLLRGFVLPETARQWRIVLGIVVLNVLAPFLLIGWAELTISSGETALLLGAGPLFGLLLSHFLTRDDKLSWRKLAAVAVGFSGVSLVVGAEAFRSLGGHVAAQTAVLAASFCYVASGLLVRRVEGIPPTRLTTITFAITALIVVPVALAVDGPPRVPSREATLSLLYLGLFPSGIAAILRFHMIRRLGVSMFSHVGNLIPVFGVFLGALLLDEAITATTIAALALIIAGVGLARAAPSVRPPPQ